MELYHLCVDDVEGASGKEPDLDILELVVVRCERAATVGMA